MFAIGSRCIAGSRKLASSAILEAGPVTQRLPFASFARAPSQTPANRAFSSSIAHETSWLRSGVSLARPKTPSTLFYTHNSFPRKSLSTATTSSSTSLHSIGLHQAGKRSFSSSPLTFLRESYFRRPGNAPTTYGGGGGGGGRGGSSGWTRFKRRLDGIPPMTVVYSIIGVNVGIFLLWQYANTSWQRFRDPTLYYWMVRNFTVSEANLMAGRIHTLLTCCFSHSGTGHIVLNMLGLFFIAPAAVGLLGTANFLGLYLGGGILGSMISVAWHKYLTRGTKGRPHASEGASGAIYACLAFFATMFPQTKFLLFFVVPMPAWAAIGGIFAYDLYSAVKTPNAMIDSAGHIGGMVAGAAYALYTKRIRGFRGFGGRF